MTTFRPGFQAIEGDSRTADRPARISPAWGGEGRFPSARRRVNWLVPTDVNLSGRTVRNADPLTACSDEELFARARGGEEPAFAALVRRYERELYGYLRRYLGDATLADDVFQNTFLQVFTKIGKYEAGRPVRPWLYTIATHQAVDALRRNNRRQAVSLDREHVETAPGEFPNLS